MAETKGGTKGKALPATRRKSKAPTKRTAIPGSAQAEATARVEAARLAQIVNLHIGGFSLAQIGDAIGATEKEVDRILTQDVGRYVRSQPALRVFVRNFISEKYLGLLDSVYAQATDETNNRQLDYQDRALRVLKEMARLHGAEMPVQSEIKVDAAPEAVEKMVEALAGRAGLAYDASIFDVIDAEVIEDARTESQQAALDSAEQVGEGEEDGF
jgi:hypothetical protein